MIQPEQGPQGAPLWTVGTPRQTKVLDQQRGYVDGWEIPVIMSDKSTFVVTVSAADFRSDVVQKLIQDYVDRLVDIRLLQGPSY
jgi:hypothetical protein